MFKKDSRIGIAKIQEYFWKKKLKKKIEAQKLTTMPRFTSERAA